MEDNTNTNTTETQNQENTEGQETKKEEVLTFTQDELDALIQSKSDARVSQALKTAEKKAEARVKEAEKLAQMNEQQRYEYELDSREKAIAAKEHELALAENKAAAATILADKGLSAKLVDFVVAEDAETMNTNINLLEAEFKASVKAEVEKRLATSTPKKNLPTDKPISKEQFGQMKLTEQAELFNSNPELYKQLSN